MASPLGLSNEIKKWLMMPVEPSEERNQMCRELEELEYILFSKHGTVQCKREEVALLENELANLSNEDNRRISLQERLSMARVSPELLREIEELEIQRNDLLKVYWTTYFRSEWPMHNDQSETGQPRSTLLTPSVQHAAENMVSFRAPSLPGGPVVKRVKTSESVSSTGDDQPPSVPPPAAAFLEESVSIKCNCKKSRCLKLYCECFAARKMCIGECKCIDCANCIQHRELRENAISAVLSKRPDAFHTKVFVSTAPAAAGAVATVAAPSPQSPNLSSSLAVKKPDQAPSMASSSNMTERVALAHARGCSCRKTKCTKKYCVCFNSHVKCGEWCRCTECENGKRDESEEIVLKPPSSIATTTPAATTAATIQPVAHSEKWDRLLSLIPEDSTASAASQRKE